MTTQKKIAQEYAAELKDAILSRNNTYDTEIGPIADTVIAPVSNVLEVQNDRIIQIDQVRSLKNVSAMQDSEVDGLVYNEAIVRSVGGKAVAQLVFSVAARPYSNLTVQANFPVSTLTDESSNTSYIFVTTQTTVLDYTKASSYYNGNTNRYELTVPAVATVSSSAANVGPNRITKSLRALVGFDSVTNTSAASGGTDAETNTTLVDRYFLSLRGTSKSVISGIKKTLMDNFQAISDAYVVSGSDPLATRAATDAGAVDVYVLGSAPITTTDVATFTGVNQVIPFINQPAISVVSVDGYIFNTDYVFVKDTSSVSSSVNAIDGIMFIPTGSTPALGASINVTYTYDYLMSELQTFNKNDDNNDPTMNMLYKAATRVDILLTANIKLLAGYDQTLMLQSISTSIFTYINSFGLATPVELSDIQGVVRALNGVDNFVITNMSKLSTTGITDITIAHNEYARILSTNIGLTII